MKTFISGLIRLHTDDDKVKFEKAEYYLKEMNHYPINPLKINNYCLASWPIRLETLSSCEAIFLLSDWLQSEESRMEKYYSEVTGKEVLFQSRLENDRYAGVQHESDISKITDVIYEVTGLQLRDYQDGPRTTEKYFCRVLFSVQCGKVGIEPEDIVLHKYIRRDITTILYYLKKYSEELKFNPEFRAMAQKVNQKLYPENAQCDILTK